ncbi:aquaporin-like protein [Martensiomyces pterosporus]|nr:aquaporin-like protein [Martensiomyces pterosporus]
MADSGSTHHEVRIGSFQTTESSLSQTPPHTSEAKAASIREGDVYEAEALAATEDPNRPSNWFRRLVYDWNAEVGEFLAMLVFVFIGCCITAECVFRLPHSAGSMDISICFGWGCALVGAAMVAGPTSGGHLNPAVTIGKAVFGHYPWKRVPGMVFAQTLGCFVGAFFTWCYYHPMFSVVDGGHRMSVGPKATSFIFVIQPVTSGIFTNTNLFFNEAMMTFCMLFMVHFCGDSRIHKDVTAIPIILGLLLTGVLLGGSQISAIGINPARDFGPRLFILIAGWRDTFSIHNYNFYVPLLSPIVGGIAAQGVYDYLIVPSYITNAHKAKSRPSEH